MTSRLDRLFALLEHCPNATLREAAADQLGQLARKAPTEVDATLTRLHGLLRSRSWNSRVAAAEAIRAMVNHLPAWKPRPPTPPPVSSLAAVVTVSPEEEEVAGETAATGLSGSSAPTTSATFLSLSALRLDRVLANGARLYSMDARELSSSATTGGRSGPLTHQSKAKRARKSFSQESDEPLANSPRSLEIDREELNRRMGLIGDTYLSSILAEHSGTSVKDLISEEDLQMDCENSDRLCVDVVKSVNEAYANAEGGEKRKLRGEQDGDKVECSTDWPLNAFCVRLLADLWDFRWETRHGAASGLRELLSDKRQTKQAGRRHGASEAENDRANRVYLEDILVRVLCTLALDQFSDFICDEVVAPVRETAAQVLGVLASHLNMEQVKEVVRHLLGMMSMHAAGGSACFFSKTSWMAVHSGLLGLKYLLASRPDLCDQLLPLVCPSIVSALIGGAGDGGSLLLCDRQQDLTTAVSSSSSVSAGEDDIRAAAAAALLAISDTLVRYQPDATTWDALSQLAVPTQAQLTARSGFCDWLMQQLWELLTSSHELCPATGPLLSLASKLLRMEAKEASCPMTSTVPVETGMEPAQEEDGFVRHVKLVLRFMHHSSSSIRRSAILALQSLVSTRVTQGVAIDIVSLEVIFDQLFHRVILEPQTPLIQLLSNFWVRMVAESPLPTLVSATLHNVDFWLCQTMQPTSMPFPDHLLRLPAAVGGGGAGTTTAPPAVEQPPKGPPSSQQHPTASCVKYIGGREALTVSQAEREAGALDTRLTAVALLAYLCRRLCQSSMSVLLGSDLSAGTASTDGQSAATPPSPPPAPPTGQSDGSCGGGGLPVAAYLLNHLLTGVHFTDRLAMQRFLAGLLLAAWPSSSSPAPAWNNTALRMFSPLEAPLLGELDTALSSLQTRLQLCLTDVTYYEEILGLFRQMQDECRRLLSLSNSAGIFADGSAPKSGGVLNIVQCQSILKVVATKLASLETPPTPPPGGVDARPAAAARQRAAEVAGRNGQQSPTECAATDLTSALRQAELSVSRCLALQLFWSSRVELSVASAMVNLGWVLPGRLTLFIRPFMETIRAGDVAAAAAAGPPLLAGGGPVVPADANGTSSSSSSLALDLPSTATSLRLQCLAAGNLARLLWLEYCRETGSSSPTGRNPSKALGKVIQNLTKYLLTADPVIGTAGGALPVGANDIVSLTVSHFNLLDASLTSTQTQAPAAILPPGLNRGGRPLTTAVNMSTSSGLPLGDSSNSQQNLLRRDGSLLTLIALIRVFVGLTPPPPADGMRPPQPVVQTHAVDLLAEGLPTLWQLVWQEPLAVLRRLFPSVTAAAVSVNGDDPALPPPPPSATTTTPNSARPHEQFRLDVQFLQHSLEVSADQRAALTGPEEDCLCQCVCLLLALFGAFRNNCGGREQAADDDDDNELIAGLLTLSLRLLRLREARPRYAAAHALAMAVCCWPSRVLNRVLLDCLPRLDVEEQTKSRICCLTEQMAAMESIYHVIEGVTSSTHEVFISNLPVDRPLTPDLHGYHHRSDLHHHQQGDLQASLRPDSRPTDLTASPTRGSCAANCVQSSPLRVLISYVVVILTAMLHRLADPRADVRALASRIFTKLLVLLPLEESFTDCPEMHPSLASARAKGREFVQCLLHPSSIKLFSDKTHVKAELRPYQKEGVNWLLFLQKYGLNGILADDLGLGKTLQTICVLVSHHRSRRKRGGGASLVICPATLCSHWLHEIDKFAGSPRCGLCPIIYQGTLDQRLQLQSSLSDYNIVITTYDLVRNDLYFFEETFWEYLILDEGHMIKNSKSKLTCAAKRLRARHRLLLTGTPVQNRVIELWSLFDFLMPGFLGTEASFASRFARPVASSRDPKASPEEQRLGQLALEHLHRIVLPFILRRLKEDVLQDLPPKVIQDYICNMTALQQKLYTSFVRTADGQRALDLADRKWQSVGGMRPPVSEAAVVAPVCTNSVPTDVRHHGFQSMKYLLSVCNHPCLVLRANHPLLAWAEERLQSEWAVDSLEAVALSGKLVALRQLLLDCGFGGLQRLSTFDSSNASAPLNLQEDLMSQHRALIFFQTKSMLKLVATMLSSDFPTVTYVKLDGTVPISERHGTVTRFNQDPSIDILLLTTSIGGLGLNLTGADTVIFVEHDWNPCKDLQAMDRAHRIGQQRMVNVYRLITADSIEERIMSLQVFKLHIARTVVSEENQSITEADTGRIFDNLVYSSSATGAASSFAGTGSGDATAEWGDIEAFQYAEEFDLATFVSRCVSQPSPAMTSEQEQQEEATKTTEVAAAAAAGKD